MILDLKKFITEERPYWSELEAALEKLENQPIRRLELGSLKKFHYLYQRTTADLARLRTYSSEPNIRRYLEALVARAYGEIHESRDKPHRLRPFFWFFTIFPKTFRRHVRAFWISTAAMALGCIFGAFALGIDPGAKAVIMPFSHLQGDPSDRVAREEGAEADRLKGAKTYFSSYLMTHNTRVSIFTLALGMTYGIGTLILLFYNGVILGAVAFDYLVAGEGTFLMGWLLPHGAIEIPAILLAGQAGLMLASALIGWGKPLTLRMRLRKISPDLVTLILGAGLMLLWAGIIEAFFSQYHEPVIPYAAKIGFGMTELIVLTLFLSKAGREPVVQP
jgi:uncharacterized membrane protein SpoIIM required for sporulation